jgi:hypothetical protein
MGGSDCNSTQTGGEVKTIYRMPAFTKSQLAQLTLSNNSLNAYADGLRQAAKELMDARLSLLLRHHPDIDLSKVESVHYSIVENAFHLKFKLEAK